MPHLIFLLVLVCFLYLLLSFSCTRFFFSSRVLFLVQSFLVVLPSVALSHPKSLYTCDLLGRKRPPRLSCLPLSPSPPLLTSSTVDRTHAHTHAHKHKKKQRKKREKHHKRGLRLLRCAGLDVFVVFLVGVCVLCVGVCHRHRHPLSFLFVVPVSLAHTYA